MIKRENSVFDATPRTHSPDDSASFIVLLMSLVFRKLALGALLEELLEHCLKSMSAGIRHGAILEQRTFPCLFAHGLSSCSLTSDGCICNHVDATALLFMPSTRLAPTYLACCTPLSVHWISNFC
mmetsp:Transcript_57974/g.125908  ORF Transcript_57974/g.125908 Transcript_57974/m.125908 type:complete len:125 (+) Transcript_57974:1321-1695(+)